MSAQLITPCDVHWFAYCCQTGRALPIRSVPVAVRGRCSSSLTRTSVDVVTSAVQRALSHQHASNALYTRLDPAGPTLLERAGACWIECPAGSSKNPAGIQHACHCTALHMLSTCTRAHVRSVRMRSMLKSLHCTH